MSVVLNDCMHRFFFTLLRDWYTKQSLKRHYVGSGGIRTHAIEMTGALNQRLRPLGHATSYTEFGETPKLKITRLMSLAYFLKKSTFTSSKLPNYGSHAGNNKSQGNSPSTSYRKTLKTWQYILQAISKMPKALLSKQVQVQVHNLWYENVLLFSCKKKTSFSQQQRKKGLAFSLVLKIRFLRTRDWCLDSVLAFQAKVCDCFFQKQVYFFY